MTLEYGRLQAVTPRQRECKARLVFGAHRSPGVVQDPNDLIGGVVGIRIGIVQHHRAIRAIGNADTDTEANIFRTLVHLGHLSKQLHVGLGGIDVACSQVGHSREDCALLVDLRY